MIPAVAKNDNLQFANAKTSPLSSLIDLLSFFSFFPCDFKLSCGLEIMTVWLAIINFHFLAFSCDIKHQNQSDQSSMAGIHHPEWYQQ